MKIILGSTSEQKMKIVQMAVSGAEVVSVGVESGVADQPLDEETTIQGAVNRAKNAIAAYESGDFDLAMGLEGGLVWENDLYNLLCVAAIVDQEGKVTLGKSEKRPLPKEVSEQVKNGGWFGKVIRDHEKKLLDERSLKYVQELISREESFKEAILEALPEALIEGSVLKD
jgi:inosine/xanthosine triphosphatase